MCDYCGYAEESEKLPAADTGEQLLDFALPTTRGHRWAEAQHRLVCEQCGSVCLLPVGQQSSECPYCGSRRLIESAESVELIDPQAIALAQFDEQKAARYVREWLGRGWFIPDDLRKLAISSALRPAYYPFWTFDGTLELGWSCEVNEGSGRSESWVTRSGVEFEMFDDVLVPGLRSLSRLEASMLESFELKKVVEFKPEHIAGWTALTYDIPLADASLTAREKVARMLRQQLANRVELGSQKRNLQSGATNWSGLTYKHILLPLWVGTYSYKNRRYRVLINGQTGRVSGVKPNDPLKAFGFFASLTATVVTILLVLAYLAFFFGWLKPFR
jgi:DNA-directed RNA polymerase subunit RPC12/RpoP